MMSLLAQIEAQGVPQQSVEWSMLWPIMILSIGAVLLVTITSLAPSTRNNAFPAIYTAVAGVAAAAFLPGMWSRVSVPSDAAVANAQNPIGTVYQALLGDRTGPMTIVNDALIVDHFTLFITGIICLAVVLVALVFHGYLEREGLAGPEWYVLLLLSASGGVMLASAEDLIVTFLGLEILSIAVYVLAALHLRRSDSQEAGFKYFILGALSSAFFLYGIALVYGATGSTRISDIAGSLSTPNEAGLIPNQDASMLLVGAALLLVGFGFKVSAAPFHVWTPDVYEGSPSPVVAFMASAVKVAGFAGMVRVFVVGLDGISGDWRIMVAAMAVLTLVVGSFLAVVQTNVKRMMAYSSIAHAGFMLVALFVAGGVELDDSIVGAQALLFYFFAYSVMVIGTFTAITVLGRTGDGHHSLDDYKGLAQRQPVIAGCLAVLAFAQAGIPFTSGFFSKFRVIAAAAGSGAYVLAAVAMLTAAVSAYLYLRLVVAIFLDGDGHDDDHEAIDLTDGDAATAAEAGDGAEAAAGAVAVDAPPVAVDREVAPVPTAALAVLVATVVITVLFGVLPGLGGDILRQAAEALS